MSSDGDADALIVTRKLLTRFFTLSFAKPQSFIGDFHTVLGTGVPAETHAVLSETASARQTLVDALNAHPVDASGVIGCADAYVGLGARVAATQLMQQVATGEPGKKDKDSKKASRPFVWTSVLDNRARSAIWTTGQAAFDVVYACVALACAHVDTANRTVVTGNMPDIVQASKHLRTAGGALIDAADKLLVRWDEYIPSAHSPELSAAVLRALGQACVAQAQQCALYKAAADGKPASLLVKLAAGLADMYRDALRGIQAGVTAGTFGSLDAAFMEHMTVMTDVSAALAEKYLALDCYNTEAYGHAVAHLDRAVVGLQGIRGLVAANKDLEGYIAGEASVLAAKYRTFKMENETIYFERMPDPADLAKPAPIKLAKPEPLKDLPAEADPLAVRDAAAEAKGEEEAAAAAAAIAAAADAAEAAEAKAKAAGAYPANAAGGAAGSGASAGAGAAGAASGPGAGTGTGSDPSKLPPVNTAAPSAAGGPGGKLQLGCASCAQAMQAPAGSSLIKCPHCQKINVNVCCGACGQALSFLQGHAHVMCPSCRRVNKVV